MTQIAYKSIATLTKMRVVDGPNAETLANSMLFQRPALVTFSVLVPHPFWKQRSISREVTVKICGIHQARTGNGALVLFVKDAVCEALKGKGAIYYNPVLRKGVWHRIQHYCDPEQVSGSIVDILV